MDSIVSERLKKALDDRSLKQADLARITGISKGSISGYVNGSFKPKDDNIEAMALH